MAKRNGKIVTFYSYKGGTGRSMAVANIAWILASNGYRVLAVDWDLEAPGLFRYFAPFLIDRELRESKGLMELVTDYCANALRPLEQGERPRPDWYKSHADIRRYRVSVNWPFLPRAGQDGPGKLHLMPAGTQGRFYSSRVNSFDWGDFYDRLGGKLFLDAVRQHMRDEYDWILIDSRTGVSDTAGICTVQMPDMLVVGFTPNIQSMDGAAAIASSVLSQRDDAGLRLFPVPMRVEKAEKHRVELMREYFRRRFDPFLASMSTDQKERYWNRIEVEYVPFYAYNEVLATFGDRPGQVGTLLSSYETLTTYLTGGRVTRFLPSAEPQRQEEVLSLPRQLEGTSRDKLAEVLEGRPSLERMLRQTREAMETWSGTGATGHLLDADLMAHLRDQPALLAAMLEDAELRAFWNASIERSRARMAGMSRLVGTSLIALALLPVVAFLSGTSLDTLTLASAAGILGGLVAALRSLWHRVPSWFGDGRPATFVEITVSWLARVAVAGLLGQGAYLLALGAGQSFFGGAPVAPPLAMAIAFVAGTGGDAAVRAVATRFSTVSIGFRRSDDS